MVIDDDDSFDSDYLRDEATQDGWAPAGEECDDFLEDDLIDYDFSCPGYYNEADDTNDIDWSTANDVDFDWNDVRIDWTDIRNEIAYDAWLYKDPDDNNNTDDDDDYDDYDDWENQQDKNEEEKDTAQTATPTTLEAAKSAAKQRALELRQLGAVVFSGYFQCLHCGEYGTTTFPHNWKPCAACKPCKNCGGIHAGRSTSDCPNPDPNIYEGNTPVAAWGMQF